MVEFKLKVDRSGKIYFPKTIREAGFSGDLRALPNWRAMAIYPPNAKSEDIIKSLRVIIQDLEHRMKVEESHALGGDEREG